MDKDFILKVKRVYNRAGESINNELIDKITPEINQMINNKIQDTNTIENYLDILIGLQTKRAMNLFITLCTYYETVNIDFANDYWGLFREEYDLDNQMELKRAKKNRT